MNRMCDYLFIIFLMKSVGNLFYIRCIKASCYDTPGYGNSVY